MYIETTFTNHYQRSLLYAFRKIWILCVIVLTFFTNCFLPKRVETNKQQQQQQQQDKL